MVPFKTWMPLESKWRGVKTVATHLHPAWQLQPHDNIPICRRHPDLQGNGTVCNVYAIRIKKRGGREKSRTCILRGAFRNISQMTMF
jgi:hypothetical protein